MGEHVGVVGSLWRYPVKSLLGEALEHAAVETRGLAGDRLYAVRNPAGKFGSGKTTRRFVQMEGLFLLRARLEGDAPVIGFPDGTLLHADDPRVHEALSTHVGETVTLAREADVSHFDAAPIHLVTTAALRSLGGTHGAVDPRRFRPNLVIACDGSAPVEDGWLGRELAVGDEVRLRVTARTERCVMVAREQQDLPEDPALHRSIVTRNENRLGVYAIVLRPGVVRAGAQVGITG